MAVDKTRPNNSLETITKTTLGVLMMTKLGSISRDAFPHRLDGMTDGSEDRLREI
jgi:hypothetical protein